MAINRQDFDNETFILKRVVKVGVKLNKLLNFLKKNVDKAYTCKEIAKEIGEREYSVHNICNVLKKKRISGK